MNQKIVISGHLVEYVKYQKNTDLVSSPGRVYGRDTTFVPLFGKKRIDNLARARQNCVRRMFASASKTGIACFVTLTFKEEFATDSYRIAGKAFGLFCARLSRKYKGRFPVVAVPERHESGRVHIHAVFFGTTLETERERQDIERLWANGFVKIKGRKLTPRLCFYLAKYITKQDCDFEPSARAFWTSHGIEKPLVYIDEHAEDLHKKLDCDKLTESSRGSVYFRKI